MTPNSPNPDIQRRTEILLETHLSAFDAAYARCFETDLAFLAPILAHLHGGRGKRLRPILFFLSQGLLHRCIHEDVRVPVLLELLHTASLIHDDVVDDADLRRGEPTLNARWGNKVAVLTGDYLFAQILSEGVALGKPGVIEVIARCARQMGAGELRQTLQGHTQLPTREHYFQDIEDKTATLFSAACELAAWICEATPPQRRHLADFGRVFGQVFQIRDDILDFVGDDALMGKPRVQDARDGKATLPVILAVQGASVSEAAALGAALAQRDESGAQAVRRFVLDHGGIEAAQQVARDLAAQAATHLSAFADSESKQRLLDLVWADLERQR